MPSHPPASDLPNREVVPSSTERLPYDPPRVLKKRSVARVTLLTGTGGTSAGALASFNT